MTSTEDEMPKTEAPTTDAAERDATVDDLAPERAPEPERGPAEVVAVEVVPVMPGLPERSKWEQMLAMSEAVCRSNLVPSAYRGKAADVLLVLLASHDIGITATQGFAKLHVIEGRLSMSAELMVALVLAQGHQIRAEESTSERAVAVGRRRGEQAESRVTWTLEDAARAGLCTIDKDGNPVAKSEKGKPLPWQQYPQAMLWARSVSQLCRMLFPDVLAGVSYTPEELGSITNEAGDPAVSDAPPSQRDQFPEISDETRAGFTGRIGALSDRARVYLAEEWKRLQEQGDLPPLRLARECDVRGIETLLSRWEERDQSVNEWAGVEADGKAKVDEALAGARASGEIRGEPCSECGVDPGEPHAHDCTVAERTGAEVLPDPETPLDVPETASDVGAGGSDPDDPERPL